VDDDAAGAYALVYGEAVRALARQRDAFESLRTPAGALLSGAAIASSLFGGQAVAAGRLGPFGWGAVAAFAALGLAILGVLWPRSELQDTALPSRLLDDDIEGPDPLPLKFIHRELAVHMEEVHRHNDTTYDRLASFFRMAAVLLNVEVLAWVLDLVTKG
jgi:hypothetical protein